MTQTCELWLQYLHKAQDETHGGGDDDDEEHVKPDPRLLRAGAVHSLRIDGKRHNANDEVGHEEQQEDHLIMVQRE